MTAAFGASATDRYAFAGISVLARELRRGRVSARELAELTLARLELLAPSLNALATLTANRALTEAGRADRMIARGDAGLLTGVPYGAKDLIAAAGVGDLGFDRDATVVARLKRAGAVLAAKLAVENAGAGWSRLAAVELVGGDGRRPSPLAAQGYGRNPWNPAHWSGGSSSGSAAAVAAGLLPYALGAETSGSVVGPAAFCGLTAIRPTYGAVSRYGVMAEARTLDKVGVLSWSADDCALVYAAIAGRDHADPTSVGPRFAPLTGRDASTAIRRVRLGFAEEDFTGHFAGPLAELSRISPKTAQATLPDYPYREMVSVVLGAEGATENARVIESDRLERVVLPRQIPGLRAGLAITARAYLDAMRARERLREDFRRLFSSIDVLVAPTQPGTAPLLAQLDDPRDTAGTLWATRTNAALTAAANLAGLPGVAVPCGLAADGLPIGVQLVGPPFSEPLLLALAAAYQRATDHHLNRPKIA